MAHKIVVILAFALTLSASAEEQASRIRIYGNLPLWHLILSDETVSDEAAQAHCKGWPNELDVAKCLQQEMESVVEGMAFISSQGSIRNVLFNADTVTQGRGRLKKAALSALVVAAAVTPGVITFKYTDDEFGRVMGSGLGIFTAGGAFQIAERHWPRTRVTSTTTRTFRGFSTSSGYFEAVRKDHGIVILEGKDIDGNQISLLIDGGMTR